MREKAEVLQSSHICCDISVPDIIIISTAKPTSVWPMFGCGGVGGGESGEDVCLNVCVHLSKKD